MIKKEEDFLAVFLGLPSEEHFANQKRITF